MCTYSNPHLCLLALRLEFLVHFLQVLNLQSAEAGKWCLPGPTVWGMWREDMSTLIKTWEKPPESVLAAHSPSDTAGVPACRAVLESSGGAAGFAGSPAVSSPLSQFSLSHLLSCFQTRVSISSLHSSCVFLAVWGLCLFPSSAVTTVARWEGSETNWCAPPAMFMFSREPLTAAPGRACGPILQTRRLIYGEVIV